MTGKYDLLEEHLKQRPMSERRVTLSLAQIETILGAPLPKSAFEHREWWSNQTDFARRPQAKAWMSAGYEVESIQQGRNTGMVRFTRQ